MEWRHNAKKPASCADTAQNGKPRCYNICYVWFCHLLYTHGSMAILGILFSTITRTLHQIISPKFSGCFSGMAARYLQPQDKMMGQCKGVANCPGTSHGQAWCESVPGTWQNISLPQAGCRVIIWGPWLQPSLRYRYFVWYLSIKYFGKQGTKPCPRLCFCQSRHGECSWLDWSLTVHWKVSGLSL